MTNKRGDPMIQFIVGIVIGVFLTLLCIGVWAVLEEDKDDIRCNRNNYHDRH